MNSENNIAIPEINTVDVDHYVNLSTIQQEDLKNPVESNQETLEEQINREQWVKLSLDEVHAKMKELKIPDLLYARGKNKGNIHKSRKSTVNHSLKWARSVKVGEVEEIKPLSKKRFELTTGDTKSSE